jgi:hypothetical protein
MTEVVLLFPVFIIILYFTAKIFSLLVLVQKMEVAAYYAARKWQLESHIYSGYATGWDEVGSQTNNKGESGRIYRV